MQMVRYNVKLWGHSAAAAPAFHLSAHLSFFVFLWLNSFVQSAVKIINETRIRWIG